MGTLKADTVQNTSGGPVTLTDQSAAKAWINFNGTGTISTRDSFNISSISDSANGDYTPSFVSSFSNSNYCFNGTSSGDSGNYGYTFIDSPTSDHQFVYSTSSLRLGTAFASATNSTATNVDAHQVNSSIHGDLA